MAVIMPAAGLLYDKIGPRWPATIGLAIVALGTYMLHRRDPGEPHRARHLGAGACGPSGWAWP